MNCPKCGSEISENQKFCSNCGANLENLEENTTENFTEEKSNMDIKQFFKKNLVVIISACVIGLPLIAFGTVKAVDYHNKVKPFETVLGNNSNTMEISIKYDKYNKNINIELKEPDVIIEEWQLKFSEITETTPIISIAGTENITEPKIEYNGLNLELGKPAIIKFIIQNQSLEDFVKIKELAHISKLKYSFPYYLSNDPKERQISKANYEKIQKQMAAEEKQKAEEEEIIDSIKEYAFMGGYGEHDFYTVDFNPRKCLFKVKGICFGRPFFAKGMSYMDCKENKDRLGISSCKDSNDIYASTAYVCGGVKNMPTPDELVLLAQDMYDNASIDNLIEIGYEHCLWNTSRSCNEPKAQRNNKKPYLEYFREIYSTNTDYKGAYDEKERAERTLIILSNMLVNDDNFMIRRRFYNNGAELRSDYRTGYETDLRSHSWLVPYSICVQRDKNYVTPKNQRFPIKVRPKTTEKYNKEAENTLF